MRFFTAAFGIAVALAATVLAAENPIIKPDGSEPIKAGTPYLIQWTPTTKGPVTLTLRQGDSNNLDDVAVIVSDPDNSGTYEWTPPKSLPAGKNYALMISDGKNTNYTPLLAISSNTPPSSSSASASASETSSMDKSSTASGSKTSSASKTASHLYSTASVTKTRQHSSTITAPVNSTLVASTTQRSNSTMLTKFSNGTTSSKNSSKTSDKSSTLEPTKTDASSSATVAPSTVPSAAGAATALARSPLALVACVVGALFYLN